MHASLAWTAKSCASSAHGHCTYLFAPHGVAYLPYRPHHGCTRGWHAASNSGHPSPATLNAVLRRVKAAKSSALRRPQCLKSLTPAIPALLHNAANMDLPTKVSAVSKGNPNARRSARRQPIGLVSPSGLVIPSGLVLTIFPLWPQDHQEAQDEHEHHG